MRPQDFFRILLPNLLDAALILLLALIVPTFMLLAYWELPPFDVFHVIAIANGLKRLAEVILIILPLASLYIASSFVFQKGGNEKKLLGGSIYTLFFFGPLCCLLLTQPSLYYFVLSKSKHEILTGDELLAATLAMLASIACLFVLETFMSVCRALSEMRLSPPQPPPPPAAQNPPPRAQNPPSAHA